MCINIPLYSVISDLDIQNNSDEMHASSLLIFVEIFLSDYFPYKCQTAL